MGERGVTGTPVFGGALAGVDYNERLNGPEAYDEFDKMRKSDGQVGAAMKVLKLPLLNAEWGVEPASDSAQDREIAEKLEQNLREDMSHTWDVFLRQALLMLDYGSMPIEPVWELRDGFVAVRKLAPRLPKTVYEWQVDRAGGLQGIRQQASAGGFQGGVVDVFIPASKLLVFVNDFEGSNFRGVSILRNAWKHWFLKEGLERVHAMALEKRTLGIDVGTLKGEGITATDKDALERALMTLHAHEKNYFVEVEGQSEYRLEGTGAGGLMNPIVAIEYHDLRIVRSLITEFLAMGSGSTGSLAMHKDKTSFTMLALGGHANNFGSTVDRHLIRPWVDYNWRVDAYPKIHYSRLDPRDLVTYADAVEKLTRARALSITPDIERASRELLDLEQLHGDPPAMRPDPLEAAAEEVRGRQLERIAEQAEKIVARGDLEAALRLSIPYRPEMVEAMNGDVVEASAQAAELKAAVVRELRRQISAGEFDRLSIERL